MKGTEYTRRSAVALLAGVTLAGCSALSEGSYWDDPPAFDATGLDEATSTPLPDRPDPIPVDVDRSQRDAYVERVASLLDPIPEPLTAEIVPNGKIREEIVDRRAAARKSLEEMNDASKTLATIDAAANAGDDAAAAAGIWALITTDGSLDAVRPDVGDLDRRARSVREAIPDVARDPVEGAVVYGAIGQWLRQGATTGRRGYRRADDPLRKGDAVGEIERARAAVAAGEYAHASYVDGLENPRPVEAPLSRAEATLGPRLKDRLEALAEPDNDEHVLMAPPRVETLLERDYQDGEPGVRLLRDKVYEFYDTVPYEPIAWPDSESEDTALEVRNTTWALVMLDAIDALRARVEDGEELFPADGAAIGEARDAAIEGVQDVARSGSPLGEWLAWRLVPRIGDADAELAALTDVEPRSVADVYGEYRWVRTMADAVPGVLDVLTSAFEGEDPR